MMTSIMGRILIMSQVCKIKYFTQIYMY